MASGVQVLVQNCRSLTKNLKVLYILQTIGLTETWLSNSIFDSEILRYTMYRKDRASCGSGVLLVISHEFPCKQLSSPSGLEVITVSVSLAPVVTCCIVYALPNATIEYHTELNNYLATITSLPNPVFNFGDFNMPNPPKF